MDAIKVQVTIDCADPAALAPFWADALGYVIQPPPEGFSSWPEALAAWGVPESEFNSASAVVDPHGSGPRVYFQRVPEPKATKNRLHLDLGVSDGPGTDVALVREQVRPTVERLVSRGATTVGEVEEMGSFWVVLQDPEGNEFCVT
ncbi:MAG TPA: VOC family protein [Nocardioidaceae bacterium]|nr:VOC family protein [Nocardioidaceae bacterium]